MTDRKRNELSFRVMRLLRLLTDLSRAKGVILLLSPKSEFREYFKTLLFLLFQAKRVVLYLGRAQPVKTLEEVMAELQTVETLNCTIERTETPPFYRYDAIYMRQKHLVQYYLADLRPSVYTVCVFIVTVL